MLSTQSPRHTHARVIRLTHSCPFHTLTEGRARMCTGAHQVPLRVEGPLVSVVTQSSERFVRVSV